jgi:hypothetical protein
MNHIHPLSRTEGPNRSRFRIVLRTSASASRCRSISWFHRSLTQAASASSSSSESSSSRSSYLCFSSRLGGTVSVVFLRNLDLGTPFNRKALCLFLNKSGGKVQTIHEWQILCIVWIVTYSGWTNDRDRVFGSLASGRTLIGEIIEIGIKIERIGSLPILDQASLMLWVIGCATGIRINFLMLGWSLRGGGWERHCRIVGLLLFFFSPLKFIWMKYSF